MSAEGRACGECNVCCVVFKVVELDKAAGVACRNLTSSGCGIHKTRPFPCRNYECLYLQGVIPSEYRPDKIGIILSFPSLLVLARVGVPFVIADEVREGAYEEEGAKKLIAEVSGESVVCMNRKNKAQTLVGPDAMVDRVWDVIVKGGLD